MSISTDILVGNPIYFTYSIQHILQTENVIKIVIRASMKNWLVIIPLDVLEMLLLMATYTDTYLTLNFKTGL